MGVGLLLRRIRADAGIPELFGLNDPEDREERQRVDLGKQHVEDREHRYSDEAVAVVGVRSPCSRVRAECRSCLNAQAALRGPSDAEECDGAKRQLRRHPVHDVTIIEHRIQGLGNPVKA